MRWVVAQKHQKSLVPARLDCAISIRSESAQQRAAVNRAPHNLLAQQVASYSGASSSQVPHQDGAAVDDDSTVAE